MRLSDFAPRLNGIVQVATIPGLPSGSGLGDTLTGEPLALATVSAALQSFLAGLTWAAQVGNATPPDQFLAALQYDVHNACVNTTTPCDPNSPTIRAAIQQAYQTYLAAYTGVVSPNALNTTAPGASAKSVTGAFTINNVSGGSSTQFRVGDGYRVLVSGAPNQPVLVTGSKNGQSTGTTQVGTTDSSGNAIISGVMGAGDVGTWAETWAVGGQVVGQTSFTVVNAAPTVLNPPTNPAPVTTTQVLNNQTQGGSQATAAGTSGSNVPATGSALDWLTKPISDSIPIPMWVVLAGGVVAVIMLTKK